MAKKIPKSEIPRKPKPDTGEDDLNVLHPEQSFKLAGRDIVVREYGFIEGLRLRPLTQPIIDALYELIPNQGTAPELEDILGVLAVHDEALVELMSVAADVEVEWIEQLNQDDGYTLMMAFWSANGPFFIRRVFNRRVAQIAVENLRDGLTFTERSSPPDMETEPPQASDD